MDSKVTDLGELTTVPVNTDLLYIVDDVTGTPISKKISVANLLAYVLSAGNPINMVDNLLTRPKLLDVSETVSALGDLAGGTDDIDLTLGNIVTATVSTSEQTFTFSNPPISGSNGSFVFFITNGGSQTINWPSSVDWVSATPPTLTASGVDVLVFTTNDAGTIWSGFVAGLEIS